MQVLLGRAGVILECPHWTVGRVLPGNPPKEVELLAFTPALHARFLDAIQGMDARAARGAAGINGFARSAESMARVLRDNPRLAMAFLDLGGFEQYPAGQKLVNSAVQYRC